jgi:hypothetical protein
MTTTVVPAAAGTKVSLLPSTGHLATTKFLTPEAWWHSTDRAQRYAQRDIIAQMLPCVQLSHREGRARSHPQRTRLWISVFSTKT